MENTKEQFDAGFLAAVTDKTEVQIIDPRTKQPTGLSITVYGRDSDKYKRIVRMQTNRRLKSMGRRITLNITAEENEAEQLELLTGITESWVMVYKGANLECTPDNVRMVYTSIPVIREQVEDAIGDRGNFMAH